MDEFDPPPVDYRLLSQRHSVARKQHECYACSKPILPGERLVRITAVIDGAFGCWSAHDPLGYCAEDQYDYY